MPLLAPNSPIATSLMEFSREHSPTASSYWLPVGFWFMAQDPQKSFWHQEIIGEITGGEFIKVTPIGASLRKMAKLSMLEVVEKPCYPQRTYYCLSESPEWEKIRIAADQFVSHIDPQAGVH